MFVGFISSEGLVKRGFVWGETVGVVKTIVSSFKWHIAQPTMGGRRGSGRGRKRDSFSTSVESTWKRHDKVPVPRNSQYDIKGLHHHPCLFPTLVCQQPLLSMLCTFLAQINHVKSYWYTNTTIHTIEHGERGNGLCTMHRLVTAFWCWLAFQIGLLSETWEIQTEKSKSWVVQTYVHAVETFLLWNWRWIVWGWGTISQSVSVLWNWLHSLCSWKFQKHIIDSCCSMMVDVVGIQCYFCGTKLSEFYKVPQDRGVGTLGIHCYFCGTKWLELLTGTAW